MSLECVVVSRWQSIKDFFRGGRGPGGWEVQGPHWPPARSLARGDDGTVVRRIPKREGVRHRQRCWCGATMELLGSVESTLTIKSVGSQATDCLRCYGDTGE